MSTVIEHPDAGAINLRTRLAHGFGAGAVLTRGLLRAPAARLPTFIGHSCLAATALVSHDYAEAALRRAMRGASLLSISRLEWGVAATTGASAAVSLGLLARRLGAKPALGLPFLVLPTLYTTLSSREHLVLLRSCRPRLHEAGLCASVAALPQLLVLPPSLRPLVLPLVGLPVFMAWLAEPAADPSLEVSSNRVWLSACAMHGGTALRCLPEAASPTTADPIHSNGVALPSPATLALSCPSLPPSSAAAAYAALVRALGAVLIHEVQDDRVGAVANEPAAVTSAAVVAVVDIAGPTAVTRDAAGPEPRTTQILSDRAEAKSRLSRSDYKAWKQRERERMAMAGATDGTDDSSRAESESALLNVARLTKDGPRGGESSSMLPIGLRAWAGQLVEGLRQGPMVFAATVVRASEVDDKSAGGTEAGGAEAEPVQGAAWLLSAVPDGGCQSLDSTNGASVDIGAVNAMGHVGGEVDLPRDPMGVLSFGGRLPDNVAAALPSQRTASATLCWSPQEALTLLRQEMSISQLATTLVQCGATQLVHVAVFCGWPVVIERGKATQALQQYLEGRSPPACSGGYEEQRAAEVLVDGALSSGMLVGYATAPPQMLPNEWSLQTRPDGSEAFADATLGEAGLASMPHSAAALSAPPLDMCCEPLLSEAGMVSLGTALSLPLPSAKAARALAGAATWGKADAAGGGGERGNAAGGGTEADGNTTGGFDWSCRAGGLLGVSRSSLQLVPHTQDWCRVPLEGWSHLMGAAAELAASATSQFESVSAALRAAHHFATAQHTRDPDSGGQSISPCEEDALLLTDGVASSVAPQAGHTDAIWLPAACLLTLVPLTDAALPASLRATAHACVAPLYAPLHAVVAPRRAPMPRPQANTTFERLARLGLLPEFTLLENDVVEGLEPVWLLADGTPHWRSHADFFRWFATGDLCVLGLLLLLKELF